MLNHRDYKRLPGNGLYFVLTKEGWLHFSHTVSSTSHSKHGMFSIVDIFDYTNLMMPFIMKPIF